MNLETKIIIYKFTPQVFTLTPVLQIAVSGCLVCGLVQCHLAWVTFRPISGWLSDSYSRFSFHNLCMDTF